MSEISSYLLRDSRRWYWPLELGSGAVRLNSCETGESLGWSHDSRNGAAATTASKESAERDKWPYILKGRSDWIGWSQPLSCCIRNSFSVCRRKERMCLEDVLTCGCVGAGKRLTLCRKTERENNFLYRKTVCEVRHQLIWSNWEGS